MADESELRGRDALGPIGRRAAARRRGMAHGRPRVPCVLPRSDESFPDFQAALQRLRSECRSQDLPTAACYDQLVGEGLSSADAAALVGLAVGLRSAGRQWTLREVNELLFLRWLYSVEDGTARPPA